MFFSILRARNRTREGSLCRALSSLSSPSSPSTSSSAPFRFRKPIRAFNDLNKESVLSALNIQSPLDWYFVKAEAISDPVVRSLYEAASPNSLRNTLEEWYPSERWLPWAFDREARVPSGFWSEPRAQRAYMNFLGKSIGIKRWADWYRVDQSDFAKNHGDHLLKSAYSGSVSKIVAKTHSEYLFLPWKFKYSPQGYWEHLENRILYFEWAAHELGFEEMEDWYSLTSEQISRVEVPSLSAQFQDSFILSLIATFEPESNPTSRSFKFYPWLFRSAPRNYWKNPKNRKYFFDWLFQTLNLKAPEDWYDISAPIVASFGGGGLLHDYYNNVFVAALQEVYPEHKFDLARFQNRPHGLWQVPTVLRRMFEKFERDLRVTPPEDWYRISAKQLKAIGGSYFASSSTLCEALRQIYPDIAWDESRFASRSNKKSSQRWLYEIVKEILAPLKIERVLEDAPQHFDSKHSYYLDIYAPELKLAFEYQGEQHYRDTMIFGLSKQYQDRDVIKRNGCAKQGITLIEVPFWWGGDKESLTWTLLEARPDLPISRPSSGSPIPAKPGSIS